MFKPKNRSPDTIGNARRDTGQGTQEKKAYQIGNGLLFIFILPINVQGDSQSRGQGKVQIEESHLPQSELISSLRNSTSDPSACIDNFPFWAVHANP
jgi:hypothetical protein